VATVVAPTVTSVAEAVNAYCGWLKRHNKAPAKLKK
jgi:hypothetical protein